MSEEDKKRIYYKLQEYCVDRKFTKEQMITFFKVLCGFADLCDSDPSKNIVENAIQAFKEGYESAKNT